MLAASLTDAHGVILLIQTWNYTRFSRYDSLFMRNVVCGHLLIFYSRLKMLEAKLYVGSSVKFMYKMKQWLISLQDVNLK